MKPIALNIHTRPLTCVTFNRDGDLLFSSGADGQVIVYYTNTGKVLGSYDNENKAISAIDCTLDSRELIVSSPSQSIRVFDVETGKRLGEQQEYGPCKYVEWCRKPTLQNKFIMCHNRFASNPQAIKLYYYNSGHFDLIWETSDYNGQCSQVHWGPFDQTIISSHDSGYIYVWDSRTGEYINHFLAHDSEISCLGFSEDRLLMISACASGIAKLWDTVKFRCLKTYTTDRPLNGCDISPLIYNKDERKRQHVLLGGGQKSAEVTTTSAQQGKFQGLIMHMVRSDELARCEGHFGPINTLKFMPDGEGYASGGEDGYLRIYHFDDIYFGDKFK